MDLTPDANGECWVTTQADDNKGDRTLRTPLLPIVVEHLRRAQTFSPQVFPWELSERQLYPELARIAEAAGVTFSASGRRKDKFHCLRKTFGTRAAMAGVDQKAFVALMRHKSFWTTERYYLDAETPIAQAVAKIEVAPAIREVAG